MENKELVAYALKAMKNAYAPYSKYQVGAALVTRSGKIFTGCNIENASYGLSVCAERVALWKAISGGEKNLKAMVVVASDKKTPTPCGACLQVMSELAPRMDLFLVNQTNKITRKKLLELLPHPFRLKS